MPCGAKMRSRRNSSKDRPEITSTRRPATVMPAPYSQRAPGWKLSGCSSRRATVAETGSSAGVSGSPPARMRGPGEADGMGEAVAEGDVADEGCGLSRLAVDHLHPGGGGEEAGDRLVQEEAALLV